MGLNFPQVFERVKAHHQTSTLSKRKRIDYLLSFVDPEPGKHDWPSPYRILLVTKPFKV